MGGESTRCGGEGHQVWGGRAPEVGGKGTRCGGEGRQVYPNIGKGRGRGAGRQGGDMLDPAL